MTPNSPIDQWTIIMNHSDATPTQAPQAGASEPKIDLTINTKPTPNDTTTTATEKKDSDCTCGARPTIKRNDTNDSAAEDEYIPRSGRTRRRRDPPIRIYSRSPIRYRSRSPARSTMISSSTALLGKVSNFDGIADLPFPARSSVYLATFPFTDRDVKKWSWLFVHGVEDTFIGRRGEREVDVDVDEFGYPLPPVYHHRRARSPYYDPVNTDVPSIFLSRALDTGVVPEPSGKEDANAGLKYWIVVQNAKGKSWKLLIADNRTAAGIMIYYEALNGNSIPFVGAVLGDRKKGERVKFERVEGLEDMASIREKEEGTMGVVC
ncbi:uncharacterized protein BDR25DRAFT_305519 [Lindgomyces ingoldianus]|uniref:Uncharacterized protein n=1 Tax=Lindgomyces ingoldianus TaxID=673940 RepID=A0ACB6QMS3_9PLEO|nr:uncharacterized protein BDR25DRAFT_305519 [Lindgomyces ingoldianus]KAF2467451.1 hypothetical protein BDR25DRAFT_305519 [Lindgomyces ingoldianus]